MAKFRSVQKMTDFHLTCLWRPSGSWHGMSPYPMRVPERIFAFFVLGRLKHDMVSWNTSMVLDSCGWFTDKPSSASLRQWNRNMEPWNNFPRRLHSLNWKSKRKWAWHSRHRQLFHQQNVRWPYPDHKDIIHAQTKRQCCDRLLTSRVNIDVSGYNLLTTLKFTWFLSNSNH